MNDAAPALDPKKMALLVMDYQNGIIGMVPDGEALVHRAARAIAAARKAGSSIGYVRVAFTEEEMAAIPERSAMSRVRAMRGNFTVNAPETQIHDSIAPKDGDIIVRKTRVGPFSTTNLYAQLQSRGIETLVLAGLSTSGVVLSTVRDAADRDFALIVLKDACADPEPGVHEFLVEKVFSRQARVIDVAEFEELIAR